MKCPKCGNTVKDSFMRKIDYENRLCYLLKVKPSGKDIEGKPTYSFWLKSTLIECVEKLEKLIKEKEALRGE